MAYVETQRDYFAARLPVEVPEWFVHSNPVNPPSRPAYPNGYTTAEQAEVTAWFAAGKDDSVLTLPGSIAYAALLRSFLAANTSWVASNNLARIAQYRLALADAHLANYNTVPVSLSPAQVPVSAPPANTPRSQSTSGGFSAFTDTYDRTSGGNEIIPSGSTSVTINVWGGGGSGGATGGTPYGGASGGYSTRTVAIASGDWGIGIPFVVGTGGKGTPDDGSDGTLSSAGAFTVAAGGPYTLTANQGTGGTGAGGGTPGTASGGTTNTTGNAGTTSLGGAAPSGGPGGVYSSPGQSPGAGGGPGNFPANQDKGGNGAPGRVQFVWS